MKETSCTWAKIISIAAASAMFPTITSTSAFAPPTRQLPIKSPFSSSPGYIHHDHSKYSTHPLNGIISISVSPSKIILAMAGKDDSDPVPLAKEGKWQAFLDEDTTGLVYYFNVDTGVSMWEPPTSSFPKIRMTRREKKRMMAIRQAYADRGKEEKAKKDSESKAKRESLFSWFKGDDGDEDESNSVDTKVNVVEVPKIEVTPSPKIEVTPSPKIEVTPASSTTVAAASKPEEKKPEEAFVVPDFFAAFRNPQEATAKPSTATTPTTTTSPETTDSPPLKQDQIQVTTKKSKTIKIEIGTKVLPHPEKISWGGEDAIFSQGRTFGVFDGVSGAEKEEGLPLYSVTLAKEMKSMAGSKGLKAEEMEAKLLRAAELADKTATGASTAIVASLGEDGFLRALNLGDSYLLVVRDGGVVARSDEIVHFFDCPFQLSVDSPDRPVDGTVMNVEVIPGDTIVLGSDGVFDNLTEKAICDIVEEGPSASIIASVISLESRRIGDDPEAETPYAKEAKKNEYEEYSSGLGGKVDDVSCVVVRCS